MSKLLVLALFLVVASCGDDPVAPPDPFREYDGPLVGIWIEPFKLNEGDEVELTLSVLLKCHRSFSAFEKDAVIYFALRPAFEYTGDDLAEAKEGVDYTIDLGPLALPAYTTRAWLKVPIKVLADDQEEGDEYIEFVIDRIVDVDGNEIEFGGATGIGRVFTSILVKEGG